MNRPRPSIVEKPAVFGPNARVRPTMTLLDHTYRSTPLLLSVLIGASTSFVAFELLRHLRTDDRAAAPRWFVGGAFVIATGLWAMQCTALQALVLPVELDYDRVSLIASAVAALATASIALTVASRPVTIGTLAVGSGLAGFCLWAMAYIGMARMVAESGISWHWAGLTAVAVLALAAAGITLSLLGRVSTRSGRKRLDREMAASLAIGGVIVAVQWMGLASSRLPVDAVSTIAGRLHDDHTVQVIDLATVLLLGCAWSTSRMSRHLQQRAAMLAASLASVSDRLASTAEELKRSERLDPLTGLLNRLAFEERLREGLDGARTSADPAAFGRIAVLVIDIDGLQTVNDALGHAAGDELIHSLALRLSDEVSERTVVARFGGDRFLILAGDIAGPEACVLLSERLIAVIQEPYDVGRRQIRTGVSIGISLAAGDGTAQSLLLEAEAAMLAAARFGRSGFAFFEPHMQARMSDEFDLVADLRQAIDLGQLELQYQPKIYSDRDAISGVEALLCWTHPARGSVSPAVFIPLAERFGLIHTLGNWVIEQACRQIGEWAGHGVHHRVAINLSVHQLRDDGLVTRIRSSLRRHGVDPSRLLCEITETVAMQDIEATQRTLAGLGAVGIFLSIDDFGTGYSSLSYLRQLPAKQLKIDRSFVHDIEHSSDARALVDAVIHLAHALGLDVVAEGVETAGQRDILVRLGCDELQGYFFARPMSAEMLLAWIAGKKPKGAMDFSKSLVH